MFDASLGNAVDSIVTPEWVGGLIAVAIISFGGWGVRVMARARREREASELEAQRQRDKIAAEQKKIAQQHAAQLQRIEDTLIGTQATPWAEATPGLVEVVHQLAASQLAGDETRKIMERVEGKVDQNLARLEEVEREVEALDRKVDEYDRDAKEASTDRSRLWEIIRAAQLAPPTRENT